MKKHDSNGFALVEGLLVLIVVVLIAGVGYFVWHTQQETTKTLNNTDTSTTNSPATKTSTGTTAPKKYLTIKEWDVRAPYSGTQTLTYTMDADGKAARFTSTELVALDSSCTPDYGGLISRYGPNEDASPDGSGGLTAKQRADSIDKSTYSYVDGYYYFFEHPQSACPGDTGDTQEETLQGTVNNDVKAVASHLEASPSL